MFNKVILIGRLGQNAEAKTAQNKNEYVIFSIATQKSWKNDKGEYETRTEWHRVYAWRNLAKFARTLQKRQLVNVEGGEVVGAVVRVWRCSGGAGFPAGHDCSPSGQGQICEESPTAAPTGKPVAKTLVAGILQGSRPNVASYRARSN